MKGRQTDLSFFNPMQVDVGNVSSGSKNIVKKNAVIPLRAIDSLRPTERNAKKKDLAPVSKSLATKSMPREMSREHLPMLAMLD